MATGGLPLTEILKQYYGGQLLDVAQRWTDFAKDFLEVAVWKEGLGIDGTIYDRYKSIDTPELNPIGSDGSIIPSYSEVEQVTVTYGKLGMLSQIPLTVLLQIPEGDRNTIRNREDLNKVATMGRYIMQVFFYGPGSNGLPSGISKLPEYDELTDVQVLNAEGTPDEEGEVDEVWVVNWSDAVGPCLFYPKGTTAGINVLDLGEQVVTANLQTKAVIPCLCTMVTVYFAVGAPVPESVVRITNVDETKITEELLNEALLKLDKSGNGEISIFMNRRIYKALKNSVLTADKGRKSYIVNLTDKTIGNEIVYFENSRQRFRIIELPKVEAMESGGGE